MAPKKPTKTQQKNVIAAQIAANKAMLEGVQKAGALAQQQLGTLSSQVEEMKEPTPVGEPYEANGRILQRMSNNTVRDLGMSEGERQRQADAAAKASEAAAAAAKKTAQQNSAKASLRAWLGTFFDPTKDSDTINKLMNFVNSQVEQDIPDDAIMLNIRSQDFYQQRFSGNKALRDAGLAELTPAEYLAAEQTYDEILQSAGLGNLSNRANFAKLIGGRVSAKEAQDRVTNVYGRIANADTALRDEIKRLNQFGNITAADFAESLLTGKEGAASLQRKITQAEISTEFTQRGLTSATGIEELERLGVTRAKAAAGAEYAAQGARRLQDLATIYNVESTGIQQELESEAFRGLESQRRKLLVSQERAAAAGRAGTGTPSLTVSASGTI